MTTLITSANFSSYKFKIVNACSTFGKINHPNTWAISLNIFEFDEAAQDMATSLLTDSYFEQLKKMKF